jgi:hypothetical protein
MKRITWFLALAALLIGCAGLAGAQCAGQAGGGFDLLQTTSGTQDTNPSSSLSSITFTGVPLPSGGVGTADTIVCRIDPLPNPIPSGGATIHIQVVALQLSGSGTYTPTGGSPENVTVYAVINQTKNSSGVYQIPTSQLPQYDTVNASTGTMTVFPNGTFNTNSLNIQADLIVVSPGGKVTDTPIAHMPMNQDTISTSGSTWTTTAPAGYPNSTIFPAGGFYVNQPGGTLAEVAPIISSRIVRGSLYGLGLLLMAIAVLKIRSGVKRGQLSLQPIYLMGLAVLAWFVGWKSSKLIFPTIAHAATAVATCAPHTATAWIKEGGTYVQHSIVTSVCSTTQVQQTTTQ